jgi:hypothetical protein
MTVPWLVPVTRSANRMRQSQKVIIDNTFYGGPWTMCDDPETDPENISWHDRCVALIKPYVVGLCIGKSDFTGHPQYANLLCDSTNWWHLNDLQKRPRRAAFYFANGLD